MASIEEKWAARGIAFNVEGTRRRLARLVPEELAQLQSLHAAFEAVREQIRAAARQAGVEWWEAPVAAEVWSLRERLRGDLLNRSRRLRCEFSSFLITLEIEAAREQQGLPSLIERSPS